MKQLQFVFILILLLVFTKFNSNYKKKHNNKSILQEKKVEDTLDDYTLIDATTRFVADLFIFS